MEKNKLFGIISIGILFGGLLPMGLYTLIFKILERLLFVTSLGSLLASGIAAYSSVLLTAVAFLKIMNILVKPDYNDKKEIKRKLSIGVLVSLILYIIWFLIPFVDNLMNEEYKGRIYGAYELIGQEFILYEILINQLSGLLCFLIVIWIMYRKVNTIANSKS